MPRDSKFNIGWLKKEDSHGKVISDWCSKESDTRGFCSVCRTSFSIANKGFAQVLQHANTEKHRAHVKSLTGVSKFTVSPIGTVCLETSTGARPQEPPAVWKLDDAVTKAEALWALKLVSNDQSYASTDGLPQLFTEMFPDSVIAKGFQMQSTKASYVISHGLLPYFHNQLVEELQNFPKTMFTIEVDETTTLQVNKQFDLLLRYWSYLRGRIVVQYFGSAFLGHAEADKLLQEIVNMLLLDKINPSRILQLSADGPNVNKLLQKGLNNVVIQNGGAPLINIGFCNLHKVHNAFGAALKATGWEDIEPFVVDMHSWFHLSSARTDDYKQVLKDVFGTSAPMFLHHVSCRWLSLHSALLRLVDQWEYLLHYFNTYFPKNYPALSRSNARYLRIVKVLKDEITLTRLHFLVSLSTVFQPFLKQFQSEGPLIHLLFHELNKLVRTLLFRFVNSNVVGTKEGKQLQKIDCENLENYLCLEKIDIGALARSSLKVVKSELTTKVFQKDAQRCLKVCAKELISKSSLGCPLLRDAQCLHPEARTDMSGSVASFQRLSAALPQAAPPTELDKAVDEWRIYCLDEKVEEISKVLRVDDYWQQVIQIKDKMNDKYKYLTLGKYVRCALTLSHGNADVERGFSENANIISSERTCLSKKSVIGLRTCKNAVHVAGGILNIPLTKGLISAVRNARHKYEEELKEKKEKSMEEKKVKEVNDKQLLERKEAKKAKDIEKEKKQKQIDSVESAERMLQEAHEAVSKAIRKRDFKAMDVATELMRCAQKKLKIVRESC